MAAQETSHAGDGDYVTDVAYARTFVDNLSPNVLRLVAALNGFAPPSADEFDFCELGSGNGDTTATLAAAYPRARFVGVDFNPAHVAFATDLASRGGLDNVRFLQRDFEDLAHEDLPDFDFIGMHGVVSWVSPAKRAALLAFAKAKLRPGGLLYVSYNALPGWAAIEPLRKLMLDHTAGFEGTSLERAREGLRFAQSLCDAGAVYFESHPTAKSMLALMQKAGLAYVAHEYFNHHWHPMYFAEVAREMAESDLRFVGQIPLYLNFRDLAIPPRLKGLASAIGSTKNEDRIAFENLKDYSLNEFFRSEVYRKGAAIGSDDATRQYLENTPFGTLAASAQIKRELRLPHYALQLVGPLYDALIPAIAESAATAVQLAERPSLAPFGVDRIGDALRTLTLGGQVLPMRSAPVFPDRGTGYRVALSFNRMVLQQGLSNRTPLVLASPAAGTGVPLSMLDVVCLRLLTEVASEDRPSWIRTFVEQQPLRLVVADQPITDKDELVRTISQAFEQFCLSAPAKLLELGILARV
jgi:SAM-dependent methyltransferase